MVKFGGGSIVNAGDVDGFDEVNNRAASEGEFTKPVSSSKSFLENSKAGATATE